MWKAVALWIDAVIVGAVTRSRSANIIQSIVCCAIAAALSSGNVCCVSIIVIVSMGVISIGSSLTTVGMRGHFTNREGMLPLPTP